ncbi:beta-ketoacyl-[acyl-carrier-protein] synthase family protein [bacterium]|nr:beta-ketoacyl-[acyl-carrier-protein] synthase family protein [bacterium]MCP5462976.1 beta-ketoacyl-[acyl-carrier-protein] synthase family protein [bacterium]
MAQNEKVVVTGLGVLTGLGDTYEDMWKSLLAGKSAIKKVDFPGFEMEQYSAKTSAMIEGFDVNNYFEADKGLKRNGRVTNFGLVAAKKALEDAGFAFNLIKTQSGKIIYEVQNIDRFRCAVVLGVGVHNMDISEKWHINLVENKGPRKLSPFALPFIPTNSVAALVTDKFNLKGPSYVVSTACASGTHALMNAYHLLRAGVVDIVVAGGAEACITPYVYGGFDAMQALSCNSDPDKACRPFDVNRDGFIMGEGGGILVLETESHAKKRGARIHSEFAGGGMSSDAFHITIPDPQGESASTMIATALETAGVSREEVGYINAHGTSTPLNDPNESFIIKKVFGDYAYKIPVNSTKSMLGHSIGASGSIEAIVCILTILHNKIHPTRNLENPDINYSDRFYPDLDKRCDLDYVPFHPREKTVDVTLSQSFGFGGHNSAVIFRRYLNGR